MFLNRNGKKGGVDNILFTSKVCYWPFCLFPSRKDYVSKCVDYIFNTSIKAIYEEFQRGFYKICDKEVLRLFKPEELMTVVVGNTDFDWEQFEKVGDD